MTESLGLPLVTDQGWAKVHSAASTTFLGLVDGAKGMHAFTPKKAVTFDFLTPTLASQKSKMAANGVAVAFPEDGSLAVQDPGGHRLRWRSVGQPD